MELDKIEALLEKYFEGETTLQDEQQLRTYFLSEGVAPHLKQYTEIFTFFEASRREQMTEKHNSNQKRPLTWLSVASIVALLGVGIFAFFNQKEDLGTYDDPEIAFRETQKALMLLSDNVNKGVNSVEYVAEYEESRDRIFKN